jgi:hypothetical protein
MEWDAHAFMDIAIGIFFLLFGAGLAYACFRLSSVFHRLTSILTDANTEVIPLLTRVEATLDGVNSELEKIDQITGSVAEIAKTAEHTTSAVESAVVKPVIKAAGLAAGVGAGVASLLTGKRKES